MGNLAAAASAAHLTQDPLTMLPLPAITEGMLGNSPTEMPPATICKSQYQGIFYSLINATLESAVAWYAGNLKGFRHTESADHLTHVFSDAQRSIIEIFMGRADGKASSAAYETYEPGLSETNLLGILKKSVDCT